MALKKFTIAASLAAALALLSGAARAAPKDFSIASSISAAGNVDELAVSNDRFVITLDKSNKRLSFIDSWNWRLAGSISLGTTVEAMALNPRQDRLYFAAPGQKLRWMNLGSLASVPFNRSPDSSSLALQSGVTVLTGATIEQLAVIQPSGSTATDCVLLTALRSGIYELDWLTLADAGIVAKDGPLFQSVTEIELSSAPYLLLAKNSIYGTTNIYSYYCTDSQVRENNPVILQPFDSGGIAINHDESQFVISLAGTSAVNLSLFDLEGNLLDDFELSTTVVVDKIWFENFSAEPNPLVLFGQTNTLKALPVVSSAFGTTATAFSLATVPSSLAASSSVDGYVYVGSGGTSSVSILTPNPWVSNLKVNYTGKITADTFKLSFNYSASGHSFTISECPSFSISPANCRAKLDSGSLDGSGSAERELSSRDLGDGEHVLGVFVNDNKSPVHQGRNALQLSIDLVPPPQKFKLDFGDSKLIISFKSPDINDLAKYEIYYGTNGSAPEDQPEQLDDTGGSGEPVSPIIIENPEPDHDYEKVVKNLTNGTLYYAQIVTTDNSGNVVLSERQSTMPQPVMSFTDKTHDEGGFSCKMASAPEFAARGNLPEMVLVFSPLLFMLALKIKSRRKR